MNQEIDNLSYFRSLLDTVAYDEVEEQFFNALEHITPYEARDIVRGLEEEDEELTINIGNRTINFHPEEYEEEEEEEEHAPPLYEEIENSPPEYIPPPPPNYWI